MKYDYLIVGAGLFGAVCAQQLTNRGYTCLVIDKNSYIGGTCHTYMENNIIIHSFGPHVFHTNNKKIWEYINQFSPFINFQLIIKSYYKGRIFSYPINLSTFNQLWGIITPDEAKKIIDCKRIKITPTNFKEKCISMIGNELYDIFIDGYSRKQWKTNPENLDISLVNRIPIRTNYDERYHTDIYQGVPEYGYTNMISNMLKNIDVRLGVNFDHSMEKLSSTIIYTGRIDQYYNFKFGSLPYRTTKFETEVINTPDFQGCPIINYPDVNIPYTRIVEHKHLYPIHNNVISTFITREYPIKWTEGEIPLYPSTMSSDKIIYKKYKQLSANNKSIIFGGRLGSYSYLNMDETINDALELCAKL